MYVCKVAILANGSRIRPGTVVGEEIANLVKDRSKYFDPVTKAAQKKTTDEPMTVSDIAMQRQYKPSFKTKE